MEVKLGSIGERAIIERIRRMYGYGWPDDDCFYFADGKRYILLKTDSISASSHMPDSADPERIGYFLAAINLSDIAAMGGTPRYFMTALTMPRSTKLSYLGAVERGISRCLSRYKTRMGGGDLKEGREMNFAGIAVGDVDRNRMIRRNGARAGDLLCVTGRLGKNAAGYYMWKETGQKKWANMLLDVEPRIREGLALHEIGATSAIDLSDGVYSSISQLRRINKIGFEIEFSRLPLSREALGAAKRLGIGIEELALNFGGEYELMFTLPENRYERAREYMKKRGMEMTMIGRVTKTESILIKDGRRISIKSRGYEHFMRRR